MDTAAAELPLSELYAKHRNRALAIARRILKDADEAEDVVQEVFSRLFSQANPSFDGKAAYTTWLHRIMVNSSINLLRARSRRERLSLEPEAEISPEQAAMGRQMKEHFDAALEEVSSQHRQVLYLREVRGLSYPEIAKLLNIPEGTVKSALNRGRNRVHELLEARGQLEPA